MDEEFGEWHDYEYSNDAEFMQLAWKAITRVNKTGHFKRLVPLKVLSVKSRGGKGKNYDIEVLFGETEWYSSCEADELGITVPYQLDDDGDLSIWRIRAWIEPNLHKKRSTIQWIDKLRDVKMTRNKSYLPYSNYIRKKTKRTISYRKKRAMFLEDEKTKIQKRHLLPCNDYMGTKEPKGYRRRKKLKFTFFVVPDPALPNMCVWKSVHRLNKEGSRTGPHIWIPIKIVSISAQRVAGDLYRMQILYAESTALKKDVDIRSVSPNMELQQKPNGRRMLYYVQFWITVFFKKIITKLDKIRDVSPTEKL